MVNVRTYKGDLEMTCEGKTSELVADVCCIAKAVGDGVPELYRYFFYLMLSEAIEEEIFNQFSEGS